MASTTKQMRLPLGMINAVVVCLLLWTGRGFAQTQSPFLGTPFSIPGTIQAEDFDNGGEGIAYHDLDSQNQGGEYRTSGVDIQQTSDAGSGFIVGWVKAGEWLEYSVNITAAASYTFEIRVASAGNGGTFHIELDGVDKTGTLVVPNTGSFQAYQTISKSTVALGVGQAVARIMFDTDGATGYVGNFNHVRLAPDPSPTAPSIASHPTNQTVSSGYAAVFGVTASGFPEPSYQWQKNSMNIGGATNASYQTPATTSSDNGSTFRCIVSNSMGTLTSNQATLSVTAAVTAGARGRVRIVNNTVVADNGSLLRGEHILMTTWNAGRIQDPNWYRSMSSTYHFNVIRLLCYRNPIYVSGYVCDPSTQCMPVTSVIPLLDIAVEQARLAGLYVIIDYHPLGGYNEADAITWWAAVAPRYQHLPHVIYEITNEPCGTVALPPGLDAYEQRMYNLVRPLAPNTHLIMWSFPAGTNAFFAAVTSTTGISYSNASVGVHIYGTNWSHVRALRQTHPIFMTESQSCEGTPAQCQNATGSYLAAAAQFERDALSWILLKSIPVANGHPDLLVNVSPIPWPIDSYFSATPVNSEQEAPSTFGLAQNYPNPFNPSTEIKFRLTSDGLTILKVYNLLGEEVATLVNENLGAGAYARKFDANSLSSGTYLYRLTNGGQTESKKMMLVK